MVHVEYLAFIHSQRFDAILVGVGVDGFLERLTQYVLAAFGIGNQSIDGQHQVISDQRVSGREKSEATHHDQSFVFGQSVIALP